MGRVLERSQNQEQQLNSQLNSVSSKKTKVTGAAGDVNCECYDLKSITIDKVKTITSSKDTFQELKSIVGQSSISSSFMKEC